MEGNNLSSTFYCSLLDIAHRSIVYKNISSAETDDILLYLKASVAMPLYNRAIYIDNIPYFDGALVDNIPVYPLLKHKLDYIICIHFDNTCYKFENTYFDNKIIKISFPFENRFKQSLIFDQNNIDIMIKNGFESTVNILKYIMHNGYEDTDYIYSAIERSNQGKLHSLRLTGDILVTNLNRVTQKLSKRKVI